MKPIHAVALSFALLLPDRTAGAAEITLLGSNALSHAWVDLAPEFEKARSDKIVAMWGGTGEIADRIHRGEVDDVVIAAAPTIDALIGEGKLVNGSRVDVARSPIGVAIRLGATKPDLSSGETVKRFLLSSKSIAITGGPSGIYLNGLFRRMGIADAIAAKTRQLPSGQNPGLLVAQGGADVAFTQVSELLPLKGVEFAGPLPREIQQMTVFAAAIHVGAHDKVRAKALINFLATPASAAAFRKTGLEPGRQGPSN